VRWLGVAEDREPSYGSFTSVIMLPAAHMLHGGLAYSILNGVHCLSSCVDTGVSKVYMAPSAVHEMVNSFWNALIWIPCPSSHCVCNLSYLLADL
jgi:hypothetical protein